MRLGNFTGADQTELALKMRRHATVVLVSALLGACAVPPSSAPIAGAPGSQSGIPGAGGPADASAQRPSPPAPSLAQTPRDYRRDGAEHIYRVHQDKIFHGKMPPLLSAVSVTRLFIDGNGMVTRFEWLRAPGNQSQIAREIQSMVAQAQPFPKPQALGEVAYIETWLWHRNGLFQLDTLTEGQLDRKPIED